MRPPPSVCQPSAGRMAVERDRPGSRSPLPAAPAHEQPLEPTTPFPRPPPGCIPTARPSRSGRWSPGGSPSSASSPAAAWGRCTRPRTPRCATRVAMKTILPEFAADPNAMERFRREVLLARRITHFNVCRIFELYDTFDPSGDRLLVPHHGAAARRDPGRAAGPHRPAGDRRALGAAPPARRRARGDAPPGRGAPRLQAGERLPGPPARRGRPRPAARRHHRLRHRPRAAPGGEGRRHLDDRPRGLHRDPGVHGPGAADRRDHLGRHRHLRAGHRALRGAHRPHPVRWADADGGSAQAAPAGGRPALGVPPHAGCTLGRGGAPLPGEGALGPVPLGARPGPGARCERPGHADPGGGARVPEPLRPSRRRVDLHRARRARRSRAVDRLGGAAPRPPRGGVPRPARAQPRGPGQPAARVAGEAA